MHLKSAVCIESYATSLHKPADNFLNNNHTVSNWQELYKVDFGLYRKAKNKN